MCPQKSVLVVDDDEDIRANISDILEDLGYKVDTAEDGIHALELVERQNYDVALLDYKMPGMDGATLYRRIKEICPQMVAIMVTAYAGSNGVQQAKDAGTWRILRKPVDVTELLPLIDAASQQPIVLLVDDDDDFCQSLWELLRESDIRTCIATTESEGIERIRQVDFEVALIDLKLGPQGEGERVVEALLAQRPEAKVCVVTGAKNHDSLEKLAAAGIQICFKPMDPGSLLALISGELSNPDG